MRCVANGLPLNSFFRPKSAWLEESPPPLFHFVILLLVLTDTRDWRDLLKWRRRRRPVQRNYSGYSLRPISLTAPTRTRASRNPRRQKLIACRRDTGLKLWNGMPHRVYGVLLKTRINDDSLLPFFILTAEVDLMCISALFYYYYYYHSLLLDLCKTLDCRIGAELWKKKEKKKKHVVN